MSAIAQRAVMMDMIPSGRPAKLAASSCSHVTVVMLGNANVSLYGTMLLFLILTVFAVYDDWANGSEVFDFAAPLQLLALVV
jgi:hypothetical protein